MMLTHVNTRGKRASGLSRRIRRVTLDPRTVLAAGIAVAAIFVTACGGDGSSAQASSSKDPITVGIIADMTGSTKTIGEQFINGSVAAAKVFGPIDGRSVKFVSEDGGDFSASTAAAKVIQLKTQDHATAVLGMASSECEGAISVAGRVQIPMIGNSCSIQDVVAALAFARGGGLEVSVRGGGH